jgi:peptidyl-prolyl cis-trans isomerase A (cyclophilin A)
MTARVLIAIALLTLGCKETAPQDPPITPDAEVQPLATYSVEFKTSAGDLTVDVNREWAPLGADRFFELVEAGFYDDIRVFRVLPGFVAQFGMNGDPDVHRMWSNQTIADDPVVQSNIRGTLSFAAGGPNTRTTQVFINYSDNSALDDQGFSPFGMVSTGMDVADTFNSDYGETPDQVEINSAGNDYLDSNFPNLDVITSARVLP